MNFQLKKIRLIFIPFLIIAVSFILLYTFLDWLLVMKLDLIRFNEDAINIYLPIILSLIPILIWLRPRIQLFIFPQKLSAFLTFIFYFLMVITISVPTIIAQRYVLLATNPLIHLSTIDEIDSKPKSRFYTVNSYNIDKFHRGIHHSISVLPGKRSEYLECKIYISYPIVGSRMDISKYPNTWMGISYKTRINNRQAQQTVEQIWNDFYQNSVRDFESNRIRFQYLYKTGVSPDSTGFEKAIEKTGYYDPTKPIIILVPVNSRFKGLNNKYLVLIFSIFIAGVIGLLMLILKYQLKGISLAQLRRYTRGLNVSILDLFVPRPQYIITPIIIDINIFIFILMVISGIGFFSFNTEELLKWGANYRPLLIEGEWWRLFTCTFLHAGIFHILLNMYALLFIGVYFEPVIGKVKFLVSYIITGIFASLASVWWHSASVGVGASGAIFGMYGVFLALLTMKVIFHKGTSQFLVNTVMFVIINLIMGFFGKADNAAHIGGLLSGFIIGFIINLMLNRKGDIKKIDIDIG